MLQLDEKFDIDELEKVKKCPLELVLFAEYIFEDLKNQLLNFGTLMFLKRKEIMLNGLNRKYI